MNPWIGNFSAETASNIIKALYTVKAGGDDVPEIVKTAHELERYALELVGSRRWYTVVHIDAENYHPNGVCRHCDADCQFGNLSHNEGCMYSLILNRCYTTKDVLELAKYGK